MSEYLEACREDRDVSGQGYSINSDGPSYTVQEALSSVEGLSDVFIKTLGDAPSIGMNWVYPLEDK